MQTHSGYGPSLKRCTLQRVGADTTQSQGLSAGADVLLDLAKRIGECWGDLAHGLRQITEAGTRAFDVERCSIWLFDPDGTLIRMRDLYERSLDRHSAGSAHFGAEHAAYHRMIIETRFLAIEDAQNDPRTREFADPYLTRFGITSVLDAPLRRQGRFVGILCIEHVGPLRKWDEVNCNLVASLADFAILVLEAHERRTAEQALRDREARLRAIMDDSFDVIVGMHPDGRSYFVSPSATRVLGYTPEELLAGETWQHIHLDDRPHVSELMRKSVNERKPATATFRWQRADGEWRWLQAQGRPFMEHGELRFVASARDVTDQRRVESEARRRERQMVQAQKLEAVGQLAGGIAHDFNNLLTAILGHADMALASSALDGEAREEIEEIRRATHRAAKLTRQLLSLSSDHDSQPEVFELDREIETIARMLRRVIGDHIQCALKLQSSPARVFVEPSRFDQVLINLAINARDAMPKGGTLTLETQRLMVTTAEPCNGQPPGAYVCVRVRDDGVGIPEALRGRIFDPFFSTKGPGQGTGLGLTMVYAIVKQAGGAIHVTSEVGVGSCFTVLLPEAVDVPAIAVAETAQPTGTPRGTERVLLVEDEWQLRHLLHRVLANHGYQVQVAADGEQGIEIVEQSDRPFDLVVSDVLMPGMGGPELAERVREIYPETPVLFLSGYAATANETRPSVPSGADMLAKPFAPATLLERMRHVLDRAAR
jgi:two-component system, cell cycle sensor histidine kinase and response regulator CckA